MRTKLHRRLAPALAIGATTLASTVLIGTADAAPLHARSHRDATQTRHAPISLTQCVAGGGYASPPLVTTCHGGKYDGYPVLL